MAVKTEKDLTEVQKASWLKALSAMQLRNYGYCVQLLQSVLKDVPEFLPGRQMARKAAIQKYGSKKSLLSGLSSASFSTMKIQSLVKKDPVAAMAAVEDLLATDPYNASVNLLLRDASLAANLPEVATFALETIVEGNPKDTKAMHELARHYLQHEQPAKAVDVYNKIVELVPGDLAAIKGGKDASAAQSMQRGGWEREETTYRDLIKDKDQAIALEQAGRSVRSDDMIDNLLADLFAKHELEPQSVDIARKIAELYEQKTDFQPASEWYKYAASLTQNADMALVRKASDLWVKQLDIDIAARDEALATNPDSHDSIQLTTELDQLKAQRAELVLEDARKRVERNPTDLNFRFEMGEILINLGRYQEAIPELQKARQNPSVRLRAMGLLGKCFTERGMLDLAAKTLSDAASELPSMDSVKKDIVYKLGLVYEKMGQREKSIESMKQIYEVDYGYLDVAARVEGSYSEAV